MVAAVVGILSRLVDRSPLAVAAVVVARERTQDLVVLVAAPRLLEVQVLLERRLLTEVVVAAETLLEDSTSVEQVDLVEPTVSQVTLAASATSRLHSRPTQVEQVARQVIRLMDTRTSL